MTKLIVSHSTNPFYNLAIEEWAVRNIDTSECNYLFLYVNTDCVVLGRNQNAFQEANLQFCKENAIEITRRVSGGGTVFHDLENLNWTFVSKFDLAHVNNYKYFSAPIINILKTLGLNAFLNKRNAIMVGETKVSGQAQFTNRKNILSHGTLLIGSNTTKLQDSINIKDIKVSSKATPSVRSVVKNLKDLCLEEISISKIQNLLLKECAVTELFDIEQSEIQEKIKQIEEMYKTKTWIYERSSKCEIELLTERENLILNIENAKVIGIKNKKGEEINQHPFLNKFYYDII